MHPDLLYNTLCNNYPELRDMDSHREHRYADLMMRALSPGSQTHKRAGVGAISEGAISFSSKYLEGQLGRKGFARLNESVRGFEVSNTWNMAEEITKAYWVSNRGQELINEMLISIQAGDESELVNGDGIPIRQKPNGVYTARDTYGKRAVTTALLDFLVPIDMQAIEGVIEAGISHYLPELTPESAWLINQQLRSLFAAGLCSQFGRGNLPQTYREISSGRLCGQSGFSLQNVTSEARYVALNGQHEYDFSNCHYRFIEHFARQNDLDIPEVGDYVNNTKTYRTRLANRLDITPKQAKGCLLAILYGATRSVRISNGIPAIIGPEKAIRLYADPDFEALCFEVLDAGEMIRLQARILRNGKIENCRGKAIKGNSRQQLAHLLQGLESKLLHIVIRHYSEQILIIQHDGFTMSEYVDPAEIEDLIMNETGIQMSVTYQRLGLPGL